MIVSKSTPTYLKMAPTTEVELRQFLNTNDVPCHEVETLHEGSANFCWRITTLLGRRSIVKHAEPYVRSQTDFPLDVSRMKYEHRALVAVPELAFIEHGVQTPAVLHYFPEQNILHMGDGGTKDLKQTYQKQTINIIDIGQRLGTWLAKLHNSTAGNNVFKTEFDSEVARSIFKYPYDGVPVVLKQHNLDVSLGERIRDRYGVDEEHDDSTCLCHGDFWPQNVQVAEDDPNVKVEDETIRQTPSVTVIDWETVRFGNGATDAARFAAHSWLIDRFHGDRGLCNAFLTAYLAERTLSRQDKIRFIVHFAVHIIFYSRMRWTDEEGTKRIVLIGVDLLSAVESYEVEKLTTSVLGLLFK
jgi:Ser/Thr protein kinase RdoA (MazF antagonist)